VNKTFAALFVAVAVAFASNAVAADAPAAPLTLPAKPGAVTFKHDTHKALKCTQCHAEEAGGDIKGIGKDVNKDAAHKVCQECHKTEKKGPQKCADCHKKA
jgi:class III cytochrome C family protein